jgi:hypothetical protein
MKIRGSHFATLALVATLVSCGGLGGPAPVNRYMLVTEAGSRLTKVTIPSNARTSLQEGLSSTGHFRISPDGQFFLASIGGKLHRGLMSNGTSTEISGYKFGDWNDAGTRIIAVSTTNVVTELSSTGTTTFETIFNGNFGGGIFSIDVRGSSILMSYSASGWARITTVPLVGGTPTFLTPDGVSYVNPRWKPDGTKIVCENSIANRDIFVMNADGTGLTALANTADSETGPVFLDDSTVLFTFSAGSNSSVYSVPVTGGTAASYYTVTGFPVVEDIQP